MLCAPLCNEVLDGIDSRAILEYLDRSHLFIVPLDGTRHWYCYHHLFRDVLLYWLQARYTVDEIGTINRWAAAGYAHNCYVDVAVRQLLWRAPIKKLPT